MIYYFKNSDEHIIIISAWPSVLYYSQLGRARGEADRGGGLQYLLWHTRDELFGVQCLACLTTRNMLYLGDFSPLGIVACAFDLFFVGKLA